MTRYPRHGAFQRNTFLDTLVLFFRLASSNADDRLYTVYPFDARPLATEACELTTPMTPSLRMIFTRKAAVANKLIKKGKFHSSC